MSDIRAQLAAVGGEYRAIRDSLAQTRDLLQPLMVAALKAGVPQSEIVKMTGYTRESIRQLARAHGIEPS